MNKNNPLWSQVGRNRIKELYKKYKLKPLTCCVNFVIDNPLADSFIVNKVKEIIRYLNELEFKYLIIPLFGLSNLKIDKNNNIKNNINLLTNYANDNYINLLIETNFTGKNTLNLLSKMENKNVGIVYDIGNATLCSHNINHDLDILSNVISHVHIKDKDISGKNVPLGDGLVNFEIFFSALKRNNYKGIFTLETSRGENAVSTASKNINYIRKFF